MTPRAITFRCPPELAAILPRPIPAIMGLPQWFKAMPAAAASTQGQAEQMTLKKCPPFIDAMTYGYLMLLPCDIRIEDGEFSWQFELPGGPISNYSRSPLDFHENVQATGSPYFEDDRFIVKFNNFWTIETPPGCSLLITHPVNRDDLPFRTLTGLVDTDRYVDNFIHFPAWWRAADFNGVLPKGTPVAQCIPVDRSLWNATYDVISGDAVRRLQELSTAVAGGTGIYRRRFRAPKH